MPAPIAEPESVARSYADQIVTLVGVLWKENADLMKRNADLEARMGDALDEVYLLKTALRERDQLIEEHLELARKGRGVTR